MNVLRLFRPKPVPPPRDSSLHRQGVSVSAASAHLRREMVRTALRDTMARHGIPKDWLQTNPLIARGPRGDYQCYVRIQLKRWQPVLVKHAAAFEAGFLKRLVLLDATSPSWLKGVSWELAAWPDAPMTMPPPSAWREEPPAAAPAIAPKPMDARDGLNLLLAGGDDWYDRSAAHGADFQATQPFLAQEEGI